MLMRQTKIMFKNEYRALVRHGIKSSVWSIRFDPFDPFASIYVKCNWSIHWKINKKGSLRNCLLKIGLKTRPYSCPVCFFFFFYKSVQYIAENNLKPCTLSGHFDCLCQQKKNMLTASFCLLVEEECTHVSAIHYNIAWVQGSLLTNP